MELEDEVIAAWHGRLRRDLAVGRPVRDAAAIAERDAYFALIDVYADSLIAQDDPRGEVIALGRRDQPTRDAVSAWLGPALGDSENIRAWLCGLAVTVTARTGGGELETLLASPGGGAIGDLSLVGGAAFLEDVVATLAQRPHPWLRRLSITTMEERELPAATFDALIPMIPNLATLEVGGRGIYDFPHPGLSHVTTTDARLMRPLWGRGGRALPAVVAVDIAIRDTLGQWSMGDRLRILPARLFPALRSLALAVYGPTVDPWELVEEIAANYPRLARLDLPPLLAAADGDRLERVLAALPDLDYVRVAWNHGDDRDYFHPRADLDIAGVSTRRRPVPA